MSDQDRLDCDSVAPYLSAFADGELAEPLRTEVEAHISGCDYCAAQLDRIRALDQLLARLPQTTPSAGVFERTLAAATRRAVPDPRGVTREALSRNRGVTRRRIRQIIAPEIEGDSAQLSPMATRRRRSRTPWVAAAIPLVAALLLIALTATLFNRFPSLPRQGAATHPTPSAASPLQQTQAAVNAVASQLAFTPLVPTYLPSGAESPTVRVGPAEQVQANSRYLDITWTFRSGPAQSLHLRELPTGLGFYGYATASGVRASSANAAAPLAWSLPNLPSWTGLTPTSCASCPAVGQTRPGVQLALDAQPRGPANAAAVAAWLRMVSLSLDAPYHPLSMTLAAPSASLALRYQAAVSDGQGHAWNWDVTIIGSVGSQQYARVKGQGVDITEIINDGKGARLDNATQTYESLTPPLQLATPPAIVTYPLFAAGEFISDGELWNLGAHQVKLPYSGLRNVYDLYRVNAALPEHIYADATTGQVIALVVSGQSNGQPTPRPGGVNGSQTYVSTTACQPYTVTYTAIEYVPQASLPPTLLDTQRPLGWSQGTVAPAFTCQS